MFVCIWSDLFILLLFECSCFGTLSKKYVLDGELRCRLILILVVRQGGILSPSLFAIYMDDLSLLLNTSRIGCHISDVCINHVFYADDLCLMAPCAISLQELINICCLYSIEIDLHFNATKSYCMIFTPRNCKRFLYLHSI